METLKAYAHAREAMELMDSYCNSDAGSQTVTYGCAQKFIKEKYCQAYQASINSDFPALMAVSSIDGQILAVGGIRISNQPLFLEHYLAGPVEHVLGQCFGMPIDRERVVEVGNLAGGQDRLATAFLMHSMWECLIKSGYEYLVLTGTASLLAKFRRLPLHYLAHANAGAIPHAQNWGSYYEDTPTVVAGRLKDYDLRFFRNLPAAPYRVDILTRGQR